LLLVNRFAVLDVEEVNTDISESIDAPFLSSSTPDRTTQSRKPKWEKRLSKQLSVNTLDARGTSIILPIEVSTTDTSEVHSIKALLDSRAMGNFIDRVSSLGKQNMILGYTWLKDHNPEVNWQTGEVQMNRCPPCCEGCHVI